MAIRKIIKEGDPILRKICKPVTEFNAKLWDLLDDMKQTMRQNNGAGLAAPQVGILRNVCVVEVNGIYLEFVNPEIEKEEGNQCVLEGCLSVQNLNGFVNRPKTITVTAQDRYGNFFTLTAENYLAQAISHETDHLKGILFIDKLDHIATKEELMREGED